MSKESIVIELQSETLSKDVSVSDLLRKALVVATKLDFEEFQKWINGELDGYGEKDEVPEYRFVNGSLIAWNPISGWIPVVIKNEAWAKKLSTYPSGSSIAELDNLLDRKGREDEVHMNISPSIRNMLCEDSVLNTQIVFSIDIAAVAGILDAVRNIVLKWTLNLEKEGVLGEGLTFSKEEKEVASRIPQNVNHFYGDVINPQIQQGTGNLTQLSEINSIDIEVVKEFLEFIKSEISNVEFDNERAKEVQAEINTIDAQIVTPKPELGIITESLKSIRTILEGASGTVAGQILLKLAEFFSQ